MTAPTIETPRSPQGRGRTGQRSNFELYSWLFMRISGLVLVFLVLGHLFIMNMLDGGVQRINFAFVALYVGWLLEAVSLVGFRSSDLSIAETAHTSQAT